MKIVQIVAGQDGDAHILFGLSDDGSLYEFHYATEPRALPASKRGKVPNVALYAMEQPEELTYRDGCTQGWKLVCATGVMSKPVPHADDPSRCERC